VVTYRDDALAPNHPLREVLGLLAAQRSTANGAGRASPASTASKIRSRGADRRHSSSSRASSRGARSSKGPSGRGVDNGSQAPHAQRNPVRSRSTCSSRDVLPTPASPETSTNRPLPVRASSAYSRIAARCDSRSSSSIRPG
jgi:hypothetical protein